MIDLLQTLGSGVLVGLVYALLGLCIVIIFKASEAFNFAIGEFLVIGSFLFYILFFNETVPWHRALPLGLLMFIFLSFILIKDNDLRPGLRTAPGSCGRHVDLLFLLFRTEASLADHQPHPSLPGRPAPGTVVPRPWSAPLWRRLTIKPLLGRPPSP